MGNILPFPARPETPRQSRRRQRAERAQQTTLTALYADFVLPQCRADASPATLSIDRTVLRIWRVATGDPPLAKVTHGTCRRFVRYNASLPGDGPDGRRSVDTVRKHCRHLQYIINRAGPTTRQQPGADLLPKRRLPWVIAPKPVEEDRDELFLSLAELWDLITAAPDPAWRAWYIFGYNTGLRMASLRAARWDWIRDGVFLHVPREHFKGARHGHIVYLNRWAREAIEPLRSAGQETIFPWTWRSPSTHHKHRRRQMDQAGVTRDHRRPGSHGLRRLLGDWLIGENPGVAAIVLGHREAINRVSFKHYCRKAKSPKVREIMERVPQPGPVIQRLLF